MMWLGTIFMEKLAEKGIEGLLDDDRDISMEREALVVYIEPMLKHFEDWREYIVGVNNNKEILNEFLGIYLYHNRFKEIRKKSYTLPQEFEANMNNFFSDMDTANLEYENISKSEVRNVVTYIESIEAALEDALTRVFGRR